MSKRRPPKGSLTNGPSICWRKVRTSKGRVVYRPVWERYIRTNGTLGYRAKRRWPKWYPIVRREEGELLGSLHQEYKRCGKQRCRCASGRLEDRHGPYWVRRWRDDSGRARKAYVKAENLEAVRQAIERRRKRLDVERDARERHMGRGRYSWKGKRAGVRSPREEMQAYDPSSMSTTDLIDLLARLLK